METFNVQTFSGLYIKALLGFRSRLLLSQFPCGYTSGICITTNDSMILFLTYETKVVHAFYEELNYVPAS